MKTELCTKCNKPIDRRVRTVGNKKLVPKYCSNCGKAFEDCYAKSEIKLHSK